LALHPAKKAIYPLLDQRVSFLVTDYVTAETLTLMLARLAHRKAAAFGEWMLLYSIITSRQ